MKIIFYIFTFLFLVIPTSDVFACGNYTKKADTERSCCKQGGSLDSEKAFCCNSKNTEENSCNGKCKNSNCHCSVSVNILVAVNSVAALATFNLSLIKETWEYVQNAQKTIYVSIWQPPKIG